MSRSLKYAFKKSDSDSLLSILNLWNQSVQSNENEITDKYEKAVYSIFNEFYTPYELERVGSSEWGDSIYIGKFAIVQHKINYALAEFPNPDTIILTLKDDTLSLSELEQKYGKKDRMYVLFEDLKYPKVANEQKKEIINFRPETTLPKDLRLFLVPPYHGELIQFLGNHHTPLGAGGIMYPARASKKTFERQVFLNKYLNVIYGHWGGYWHLETHPEVSLIIMNPSLTKAILHFRLVYQGGEAYLENKDGEWKLVESKLTWIE